MSENKTGISFVNSLTKAQIVHNRHLLNGSGVALGDIDDDGFVDVYFCRLDGRNLLYKNLGNWNFKDITAEAGVGCPNQFSTGAALADIDGDADLDLLVTALGGPNACFRNDGSGNFTDFTEESGISSNTGATTLALADLDSDGDLDLYISNYKKRTIRDLYPVHQRTFEKTVTKVGDTYVVLPEFQDHYTVRANGNVLERFEYAESDMLFLNDGNGRFSKASFTDGRFSDEEGNPIRDEYTDWGLSVRLQDMDSDGDPDIYVCNDFESPDRIWINDGSGHFQAISKLAIRSISASSMGVDFGDINRDGHLDFFLTEMLSRDYRRRKTQMGPVAPKPASIGKIDDRPQYMRNTLFLNRGDHTYAEIGRFSNLEASEWSWTPLFLDVDLDGFEDLLIVTGHYYDAMDVDTRYKLKTMSAAAYNKLESEVFAYPRLQLPNFIFKNQGDLTFEEVGKNWGFEDVDISHGMAHADLDNDGDLDIVINRLEKVAAVYRNECSAPRIAVRLKGLPPNTHGIGAKIKVLGGPVDQTKEVIGGGSYLSHSDYLHSFAAFNNEHTLTIVVKWQSGNVSRITDVLPNRVYEVSEMNARDTPTANSHSSPIPTPIFEDVSHLIQHVHHEEPFPDFKKQPLLPRRLSQLGPGAAWFDYDNDSDTDLFIGSGRNGYLAAFRNEGKDGFSRITHPLLKRRTQQDQTAVIGWFKGNNKTSILVGCTNYESSARDKSFIMAYEFVKGRMSSSSKLMTNNSSIGPTAMADYDGDGDLDFFVGGRNVPAAYPEPPSSMLFRNENGAFKPDEHNNDGLQEIGMVSGAIFSDIDGDGDPDLVLALDWGPITILRNDEGRFSEITDDVGLASYTGWWNGVTTGDLDEDGKLDIIATNWGLNTKHRATPKHPLRIYSDDFDNNGTPDIVEAYFDTSDNRLVPRRGYGALSKAIPYVGYQIRTFHDFSKAGLTEIFGYRLKKSRQLRVNTLAHMVFLNRHKAFEAVPMPQAAQIAPAFYVGVADFDGDGNEDVFITQNFFATNVETHRYDAGRALWLKGDGTGRLQSVPGDISGIKVYGEQRGAAFADYDNDARVDLLITQNGAASKLYRNAKARAGIKVRLIGPEQNPKSVGAIVRLKYGTHYGPAREIHAGSGYWSQDSLVPVMGSAENPTHVRVRWPDGRITESEIQPTATKVKISWYSASASNLQQ
ncbi:hypothetical protein GWO43_26200 [candidate division KSB1 bacterium]|nr:hypothetical protein [candidate division KSB1 bacterium]NIR70778.1 hypothetical protein [candidate division KSB1 bacterium]NIS27450.1 hypothetical protein [candidate division KSB1 bacterium]NIT74303.1 hypothetical protein [candidate division KSB1 bacterium]NIU28166.1 hypothetical protein [candidate division KSB1 bacterium]